MVGVVGGIENKVQMGNISAYNRAVDEAFSNNPKLRDALKAGAAAIQGTLAATGNRWPWLAGLGALLILAAFAIPRLRARAEGTSSA